MAKITIRFVTRVDRDEPITDESEMNLPLSNVNFLTYDSFDNISPSYVEFVSVTSGYEDKFKYKISQNYRSIVVTAGSNSTDVTATFNVYVTRPIKIPAKYVFDKSINRYNKNAINKIEYEYNSVKDGQETFNFNFDLYNTETPSVDPVTQDNYIGYYSLTSLGINSTFAYYKIQNIKLNNNTILKPAVSLKTNIKSIDVNSGQSTEFERNTTLNRQEGETVVNKNGYCELYEFTSVEQFENTFLDSGHTISQNYTTITTDETTIASKFDVFTECYAGYVYNADGNLTLLLLLPLQKTYGTNSYANYTSLGLDFTIQTLPIETVYDEADSPYTVTDGNLFKRQNNILLWKDTEDNTLDTVSDSNNWILTQYYRGKKTAKVTCCLGEYYYLNSQLQETNDLALSIVDSTKYSVFEIGQVVVPYIMGHEEETLVQPTSQAPTIPNSYYSGYRINKQAEVPLDTDEDGRAMAFTIVNIQFTFKGVLRQILTLQERTFI